MWKYNPVKFANFVYFLLYAEKCNHISKSDCLKGEWSIVFAARLVIVCLNDDLN